MKGNLTPKQQRFVEEYLVDLNATRAAIRAGYSAKNADKIASQLLGKNRVAEAIAAAKAERSSRVAVSSDYVLSNLVEIVERSMQRAPVMTMRGEQVVDDQGRNVWRFDAKAANRALELLGKHLGLFVDNVKAEVSGPDGGPVSSEIVVKFVEPARHDS